MAKHIIGEATYSLEIVDDGVHTSGTDYITEDELARVGERGAIDILWDKWYGGRNISPTATVNLLRKYWYVVRKNSRSKRLGSETVLEWSGAEFLEEVA